MKPTVSVVIPARNAEKTIGLTLQSLKEQDYDNYEVIVVNDHSIDHTKDECLKQGVNVVDSEGEGANAARNTGIKRSRGSIVALIDADATAPKNWVSSIVNRVGEGFDLVFGRVEALNTGKTIARYVSNSILGLMPNFRRRKVLEGRQTWMAVAGCNMALKRKVWEEVGGFDEDYKLYYDEVDFKARVLEKGYKVLLDPSLVVYHKNVDGLKSLLKRAWRQAGGLRLFKAKNPSHPIVKLTLTLCLLLSIGLASIPILAALYPHEALKVLTISLYSALTLYVFLALQYLARGLRLKDSLAFPALDFATGFTMYVKIILGLFS